jgi:hypothetical protein
LETKGEEFKSGDQLEGVGSALVELTQVNLSEGIIEKHFSEEAAELNSAMEWQVDATGDEVSLGDHIGLPIEMCDENKVQQSRLQNKNHPIDQLDEVIEEIIKLMVNLAKEVVNREGQDIREPARAAGQQKQQIKGASGQLQFQVWDPGGCQQHSRGSHEQELMIFPVVEYDAGASSARHTWRDNSTP